MVKPANGVVIQVDFEQLQEAVAQLPTAAKEQLLEDLERTVHKSEWQALFAELDRRRKGRRVPSMRAIVAEVKAVRRARYAREPRSR